MESNKLTGKQNRVLKDIKWQINIVSIAKGANVTSKKKEEKKHTKKEWNTEDRKANKSLNT